MKLRINAKLRAALIAAISVVGFTITSAQAADITLANVMNQKADTPIIWGENGLDLTSVTASCSTTNVRTNNAYENSFRAVDTNVGNGATWTYTLNFTTGADTNATLSSVTADLLTFNGSNNPHNTTNYVNVDWTLSGGGQNLNGSSNNAELTFRSSANASTAAYASDGHGGYVTSDQSHYCGGTIAFDFDDFALTSNTTYTLTVAVSRVTQTGFFVGIGNVALINTPLVVTSTWNGTESHSTWSDSDAWSGTPFVDGGAAVFDGNATIKTATVDADVTADSVTVSGAAHTFELAGGDLTTGKLTVGDGGSLELTGEGTVAASAIDASGKTITINEGVVLTGAGSGTLAGEGTFALASGSKSLGSISLGEAWNGYVRLSGVSFSNDNLDNLARNGASGVEMNGITGGYAANWNGGTVHAKIRLTNPSGTNDNIAWKWSDGTTSDSASYPTVTFDGAWVGDGTFRLTEKRQCVTYSGDISGWTGAFEYRGSHGTKLTFAGNATTVNAAILNNGTNDASSAWKQFHLIVDNNATFNKAVGAYTLDITAGNTATLNGTTNIANGVTLGADATLVNTGALTLNGIVTFGGNAIENNGGTVHFGTNLVFNLDGLTPDEQEDVHTYTLFSGSTTVDLTTLGVGNIALTGGTTGKVWTFNNNGTITWTLPSELEWDNSSGNNKWSYSDANWHGSVFVENAAANIYQDATLEVSGNVVASAIAVGNGEAAANVTISAGEASSLTATTLQVDNGSLTTNVTIEGLGSNTVAAGSTWHIGADQTIAAGAIDGSVDVAQGKTVTLVQAATAKDLLLGITGQGNIALGTSVSFDSADDAAAASTKATGTLTLKEGVKLTVGNNKDKAASIASFNHVVMEQGAGIDTKSRLVEINNLTVNTDASHTDVIKMLDTYSKDEVGLNLKGTTTLDGNLEINSDWKYKVNIESLAGTGTLYLKGGSNEQHTASIGGGSVGKIVSTSGSVATSITNTTLGALELTSGSLTANGNSSLGVINIGPGTLTIASGATVSATELNIADNKKATLNINGSLDVSGNFYAIGCSNTTDITGSGAGSALTVGSLDICNFGTNFNLQNITMTVSGKANAGDFHNNNKTHIDLNAGSALNLLGEVTFNTNESKYCTLNVNGGTLTAGTAEEAEVTRTFQDIVAGAAGGTVDFLNGANTVATLNMAAGDLAVTVGEHATLTVADATLRSTITGAVTLTGTVDITNHVISDRTDVYTGGETPGNVNGFRSTTGKMVMATGTVTDEGATYMYGGTDVTSDVEGGVYNVSTDTDYTHFYINEGTETLSHAIAGATTLSSVVMSGGTLVADGESVSLEIADGAAATVNATAATTISSLSGTNATLNITGDSVVTLAANSALTSTIDISGTATVKVNANEALGNAANSITVHTGATLDVNGKDAPANKLYTLTLDGGTLANTGNELSWGSRQLVKALVVTDNSTINAQSNHFGLINGGYAATTIDLGATLEKVGNKNFYIVHSTITGDGAFKVTQGGLFFDYAVEAGYRGTLATDIVMNGGTVGGTIVLADSISVSAEADGSTFSAAVINGGHTIIFDGAHDLTVGGIISGAGGIIKDGAGTLTLSGTQTYTGTTVVKGGRLVVNGSLADDNSISVEGDATIGGNVDTTQVGIAADTTATFEQGISDASGVTFSSEEGGVEVKNTNAEGPAIKYAIDEANAQVTADELVFFMAEEGAEVDNRVVVDSVQNLYSDGALTLTNVDTSALHEVEAVMGDVVLKKVASVDLQQLTISGATVAVYVTDEQAETEGTVTITEALTSGGGTLLANLTVKGGSMLDMVSLDNELATVTLGSELSFAEDGLVSLSDEVIALLNGMEVDGYWDIFQTYGERDLEFVGDYDGAWFDSLFNRNGELVNVEGDFQIEATPDHFRLVKNSMVPEPTTGTLSLLALMALAARRRKH